MQPYVDSAHVALPVASQTPLDPFSAVFFALVLVLFVVATYRRAAYGVAGLLLIDPFALYRYAGATTVTLPKVALAGVIVGLVLSRASFGVLTQRRVQLVALAAAAVVVATALSVLQADFKGVALREALKAFEYLLVFLTCAVAYANDPDDGLVRDAALAIGALVSVLALAQEFTTAPSGLWIGHHAVPRIAGPLEGPNQLAAYLGLLLPIGVAFLMLRRTHPIAWCAVALMIVAEFLTFSRAGVATSLIAIGAVFAFARTGSRATWLTLVGAPVALGLLAVLLVGGELSRFWSASAQLQPGGLGTRAQLWTAAYRLWRAHPVLGIGAGNYEFELARAGFPELRTHPNGQYLQALVEGGIPLLFALLWATLAPIVTLLHGRRDNPLVIGALGALLGLALHQFLDSLTFFPKVGMTAWIVAALGVAALARERRS